MLGAKPVQGAPQRTARRATKTSRTRQPEWPTFALTGIIYGGFGLVTWYYHVLPWWLAAAIGTYLIAWHGSLQHEIVHGHPTASRRLNEALVFPSLWLWMPYALYRDVHLRHHRNALLTDPLEDPESYYLTPQRWASLNRTTRALLLVHNSFLGRLVLGPFLCVWRLFGSELARIARGNRENLGIWGLHAVSCSLVLAWVVGVCGIPLIEYLAFFVYPGIALSLVRSFAEHRAHPDVDERSVIVESGRVMSLLFLNNNLHALHHAEPGLTWYRLPGRFQERREELLRANGGYRFSGYGEILLRYFLWPKEQVRHPAGCEAFGGIGGIKGSEPPFLPAGVGEAAMDAAVEAAVEAAMDAALDSSRIRPAAAPAG